MLVKVNDEEYDVVLLENGEAIVILVDDEAFSIGLVNETHDALGRFAARAGSAVKKVGQKAGQGVVGSALCGGVFGGLGGALKEGVMGDRTQGSALHRAKIALVKGAIRGAKRGAMRKLVKNTLDIGAEHAGSYGWAVRAIGGLGIAVAGKKRSFGLEPGDFQKIGREMFAGGFSEFVSAQLEYDEPIYLEEGEFKAAVGGLANMIADFLDSSEEEYMGVEDGAGLEEMGFQEKDGIWYIHRDDAEELLASLLAYGETKLEVFDSEVVKLFNVNHDQLGRFATGAQIAGGVTAAISYGVHQGYEADFQKKLKERYGSSYVKRDKIAALKAELKNEKVFSKNIAGHEVSVTWGQYERAGNVLAFAGIGSYLFGQGLSAYSEISRMKADQAAYDKQQYKDYQKSKGYKDSSDRWTPGGNDDKDKYHQWDYKEYQQKQKESYEDWYARNKPPNENPGGGYTHYDDAWARARKKAYSDAYQKRAEQARRKAEEEYRRREQQRAKAKPDTSSWPKGATEDDFKKMYRKVAKKYHPDINKTPGADETMKKINEAYARKDWKFINSLFIRLEVEEDTTEDPIEGMMELGLDVLREFLAGDAEYLTLPDDGSGDWVVDEETGLAVLDKPTAQFIYDMLSFMEEYGQERENQTD